MMIVKLGTVERNLLGKIWRGEAIGQLTPNHRRALKRLESKGLIELFMDGWRVTEKFNDTALTQKEKNKVRNENRIEHKVGSMGGANATYMYMVKRIKKGVGARRLISMIGKGDLKLKQAIEIQSDVQRSLDELLSHDLAKEDIQSAIDSLIDEELERLSQRRKRKIPSNF